MTFLEIILLFLFLQQSKLEDIAQPPIQIFLGICFMSGGNESYRIS